MVEMGNGFMYALRTEDASKFNPHYQKMTENLTTDQLNEDYDLMLGLFYAYNFGHVFVDRNDTIYLERLGRVFYPASAEFTQHENAHRDDIEIGYSYMCGPHRDC